MATKKRHRPKGLSSPSKRRRFGGYKEVPDKLTFYFLRDDKGKSPLTVRPSPEEKEKLQGMLGQINETIKILRSEEGTQRGGALEGDFVECFARIIAAFLTGALLFGSTFAGYMVLEASVLDTVFPYCGRGSSLHRFGEAVVTSALGVGQGVAKAFGQTIHNPCVDNPNSRLWVIMSILSAVLGVGAGARRLGYDGLITPERVRALYQHTLAAARRVLGQLFSGAADAGPKPPGPKPPPPPPPAGPKPPDADASAGVMHAGGRRKTKRSHRTRRRRGNRRTRRRR